MALSFLAPRQLSTNVLFRFQWRQSRCPQVITSPQDSFLRRNGLGLSLLILTVCSFGGQLLTGHAVYNRELIEYGQLPLSLFAYLTTGHLVSATFENWESEFLQMGMYVLLTVWLRQKGSAESRPMSPSQEHERIEQGQKPCARAAGGKRCTGNRSPSRSLHSSPCRSRCIWRAAGGENWPSVQ